MTQKFRIVGLYSNSAGKSVDQESLLERAQRDWYADHHDGKPDQVWAHVPLGQQVGLEAILRLPDMRAGGELLVWRFDNSTAAERFTQVLLFLNLSYWRTAVVDPLPEPA